MMQVSVLRGLAILRVTPDIVIAFVVYTSLFHPDSSVLIGFVTGLLIDMYSSSPGYNALMGTLIGYGVGLLSGKIYKEVPLLWLILLFLSELVHEVVIFASIHQLSGYFFCRYIVLQSTYTVVVGLIMFYALRRSGV